jgi:hypothetical protein
VALGLCVGQLGDAAQWHQTGAGQTQIVGRRASQPYLDFVRARGTVAHRDIMWKAISISAHGYPPNVLAKTIYP